MDHATGWVKDFVDERDFTIKTPAVQAAFRLEERTLPAAYGIPLVAAVKDQGNIGSCTANAGCGMYETYISMIQGHVVQPLSRLFLYKVTRLLLGWKGDSGAFLRSTMQALTMFGVPPERHYGYDPRRYDEDPGSFLYAMAQNYQGLTYFRLDPPGKDPEKIIASMKLNIHANRPCMFGFIVYSNLENDGLIKLPGRGDSQEGGHAMYATAFDDNKRVGDSVGAFRGPNSWSRAWGDDGYFWMPYDYVRKGLCTDIWTMMSAEWADMEQFQ